MTHTPAPLLLLVSNDRASFAARLPLVQAARSAGYRVEAVLPPGPDLPGLVTHDWPLDRRGLNPLRELAARRTLQRLYKRLRPDLVHHFTLKPVVYGGVAARRADVPAVHSLTGLGYAFIPGRGRAWLRLALERLLRRSLSSARHVMFQNGDDRDLFLQRRLVPEGRSSVVPGSGMDVEAFQPLPEPPGPPVVAFIGRFLRDKGVHEFVEAARILHGASVEVRMVLVGQVDPSNRASVGEAESRAWVAEGIVEDWGWSSDVRATLAKCHVVCLPSYREGVPRTLLEAAACGRPVVATDVPGCREAVRDGVSGLLVPPRDPDALAEAIARLCADGALRARMGRAGRELVASSFSTEVVHAQVLQVYAEALGDR